MPPLLESPRRKDRARAAGPSARFAPGPPGRPVAPRHQGCRSCSRWPETGALVLRACRRRAGHVRLPRRAPGQAASERGLRDAGRSARPEGVDRPGPARRIAAEHRPFSRHAGGRRGGREGLCHPPPDRIRVRGAPHRDHRPPDGVARRRVRVPGRPGVGGQRGLRPRAGLRARQRRGAGAGAVAGQHPAGQRGSSGRDAGADDAGRGPARGERGRRRRSATPTSPAPSGRWRSPDSPCPARTRTIRRPRSRSRGCSASRRSCTARSPPARRGCSSCATRARSSRTARWSSSPGAASR